MGRNNKRRGGGRGGGPRRNKPNEYRSDFLEKSDMDNERFAAYYKAQNIVSNEEWEPLLDALRRPLPTTFRVAGSRQTAQTLNRLIQDTYVPMLSDASFEGEPIPPPVQIPWYPDGLAWQFNVPKKVLRKSPEFKKFHNFLVFETDVGNISRQEAVSMIPPLFLDVLPHHKVMDMCAAPGSKTAQLLEALHANDTATETSIPSGLLLANDSDQKRTHMLIHQSARLPSPALMVTNLDASNYPVIRVPASLRQGEVAPARLKKKKMEQLLFDRILCDVPCSGDGTMRKNLGIWKSWQPMDGNGLHSLQVRILQRGMKMLKEDGRIVYSTCSLNPVENEAVVAEALKLCPGFEIVDVSDRFPNLVRRPGLTAWRPTGDKTVSNTFASFAEYQASLPEGQAAASKMTEGHWPPPDAESLNLPRCMRIYPHLQDTGGFFVAVLEKTKKPEKQPVTAPSTKGKREMEESVDDEVPESKKPRLTDDSTASVELAAPQGASSETTTTVPDASAPGPESAQGAVKAAEAEDENIVADLDKTPEPSKVSSSDFKENPYTFLPSDHTILTNCMSRLSLLPTFPSSNVLVRNPEGDAVRSLYLTNAAVKAVIEHNDYARIRLTSAGTKILSKQEAGKGLDAQFRILGEGLQVVLPYVDPETVMAADVGVLRVLLKAYHPTCAAFEEPFQTKVAERGPGSHIIRIPAGVHRDVTYVHLPSFVKCRSALTLCLCSMDRFRFLSQPPQTITRRAPSHLEIQRIRDADDRQKGQKRHEPAFIRC
ncbi:hypothetical protein HGRIS_000495 [Hohenbuehelia grisea]|uniref:SAM-dependent MTase RsmB/NOP-type domain-containing protein n=1 Tax=Hohenbuehelia grisea TaxID=104357 RepID=A0ABR3JSK6_9AGAR